VAGLGAIVFYEALVVSTHLFLGVLAGYGIPTPVGEGARHASASAARPWALPLTAGFGALLGALLVYRFAPEAEGHGTDAAISAVHHNPRGVRFRAVVVKIVASALTIGSGGSGGREGPTGQISAGFGSLLARALDLEPADGRIAVATGVGSGIGAIFGAPLGGAVLAAEILYRDDFEPAALLPCFIASVVSYVVFSSVEGFSPLFGYVASYHFTDPVQLIWFALIGVLAGLVGLLYAKGFYGMVELFHRLPWPRWVNPAIGGVLVGAIGIAIPEVLGTGYGWIQDSLGHGLLGIPLWIGWVRRHLRARHGDWGLSGCIGVAAIRAGIPLHGPQPGSLCDRRDDELLRWNLTGASGRHADGGRDDRQPLDHHAGHGGGGHLVAHCPSKR
jgi:CIC family chloride channel protein